MKKILIIALALMMAVILATTVLAESTATDLPAATDTSAPTAEAATPTDVETPAEPAAEPAKEAAPKGPTFEDEQGTWSYAVDGKNVTITGFSGNATTLVVPARINGLRVTAIGEGCFAGNTALTSVKLPYGLKNIGAKAFDGCTGLTAFQIPGSVESLGSKVLAGCTGVNELFVPSSVQQMVNDMFEGDTQMTVIAFSKCAPAKYFKANPEAVPGTLRIITNNIVKAKGGHTHVFVYTSWNYDESIPQNMHKIECKLCDEVFHPGECDYGDSMTCKLCHGYGSVI